MRVRFARATKRFGAHNAVDGITLDVESGECLVLLGPSGCGKTTLLRLLAGLEPLDSGEIWIGDRRVDQLEPARRDVAMVFQNYALYPHLSVFDNIAFPLRTRHVETAEVDRRVREAAARVGLTELLGRRPAQLSGGQQQRVAIARTLVTRPEVLFADEPTGALDSAAGGEILGLLRRLVDAGRQTVVMVTHDPVAAAAADRVLTLTDGRVVGDRTC